MADRINKSDFAYLLSILVILNITIGVHLVHPVLHDHMPHHHGEAENAVHYAHTINGQEEDSVCPICDFLANSQLHLCTAQLPPSTDAASVDKISRAYVTTVKDFSSGDGPRGPPLFT